MQGLMTMVGVLTVPLVLMFIWLVIMMTMMMLIRVMMVMTVIIMIMGMVVVILVGVVIGAENMGDMGDGAAVRGDFGGGGDDSDGVIDWPW